MRVRIPFFLRKVLFITLMPAALLQGLGYALEYVQPHELQNLTTNSPFIPSGFNQNQVGSKEYNANEPGFSINKLDLRGIVEIDGNYIFCLQEQTSSKAFWIGMNENYEGINIVDYDPSNYTVVVSKSGIEQKIKLAKTIHPTEMTNIDQLPDTERKRRKDLFQQLSQITKDDMEAVKNKKRPSVPTRRTRVRR